MANPRQRRKARSSAHRPVSHSKNAKRNLKKMPPIRAPKVLQDAWDKQKTVRQNYAALGLVHDLNPSAPGGAEIIDVDVENENATPHCSDSCQSGTSSNVGSGDGIPTGYGRIVRDEDGNIIRIELPDDEKDPSTMEDEDMDMAQLEPELEGEVKAKWVEGLGAHSKKVLVKENERKNITEGEFYPTHA
ncbi:Nucleolar protein 16 [Paramarasmius palmivorus]|uniref:Nucleolar protein 16 n=1 Tax=Paramarasmius palmivorus TaxID=297713 RepID=A0AAW0DE25_9AGAR